MSNVILATVINEIKESDMFALQLDESTDVASCSQLLLFTRYIKNDHVKEEYLFCKSLPTTLLYHTEVRWLSRGKVLNRLYELREEIGLFLEKQRTQKEKEFFSKIKDKIFFEMLAYLADFFSEINGLNLSLQGNMTNILAAQDKVASFVRKLKLYQRRVQADDVSMFTQLCEQLVNTEQNEITFKNSVIQHLSAIIDSLKQYFPVFKTILLTQKTLLKKKHNKKNFDNH